MLEFVATAKPRTVIVLQHDRWLEPKQLNGLKAKLSWARPTSPECAS